MKFSLLTELLKEVKSVDLVMIWKFWKIRFSEVFLRVILQIFGHFVIQLV